ASHSGAPADVFSRRSEVGPDDLPFASPASPRPDRTHSQDAPLSGQRQRPAHGTLLLVHLHPHHPPQRQPPQLSTAPPACSRKSRTPSSAISLLQSPPKLDSATITFANKAELMLRNLCREFRPQRPDLPPRIWGGPSSIQSLRFNHDDSTPPSLTGQAKI